MVRKQQKEGNKVKQKNGKRRGGHQKTNEPRQDSKEDRKSDCKIKKDEREKEAN